MIPCNMIVILIVGADSRVAQSARSEGLPRPKREAALRPLLKGRQYENKRYGQFGSGPGGVPYL